MPEREGAADPHLPARQEGLGSGDSGVCKTGRRPPSSPKPAEQTLHSYTSSGAAVPGPRRDGGAGRRLRVPERGRWHDGPHDQIRTSPHSVSKVPGCKACGGKAGPGAATPTWRRAVTSQGRRRKCAGASRCWVTSRSWAQGLSAACGLGGCRDDAAKVGAGRNRTPRPERARVHASEYAGWAC